MAQPQKTVKPAASVAQMRQSPGSGNAGAARAAGSQSPRVSNPAFALTKFRPQGRLPAKPVGAFMPKLTRTAFEKFGFSTAQLLTDWAQIVGPQLAASTSPDRIKWPKTPGADRSDGESRSGPRSGATLHVRVDPARALDVQYKAALIIDRINGYFGYRAVADIRIVQTQVASSQPPLTASKPRGPVIPEPVLATVTDDGLRAALERMQSGLATRRR